MIDHVLKELQLGKYAALVDAATGENVRLGLCDADARLIWSSDPEMQQVVPGAMGAIRELEIDPEPLEGRGGRHELDEETVVLYEPIASRGWLVALLSRGAAEREARVCSVLSALAACVAEELATRVESDDMAVELTRRYEELNLLYSLDGITQGKDVRAGLRALLRNVSQHLDVALAVFISTELEAPIYAMADDTDFASLDLLLVQIRGPMYRFVCADRRTLILNQPSDPRRDFLCANSTLKLLAAPITRDAFQGMLVLVRREQQADFENSDRSVAQLIAEQIGSAMRTQSMLQSMQKFGEQLAGALIEAVEAKDPYTRGHSERVQAIAVHIGRALGLGRSDLQDLYWGSIMHDVGKIGVPDVILSKPGRLTEGEFTFIKTHPEGSYEILRHVQYLSENVLLAARHHHERFDGGGYPDGIQGQQIPLSARVVAIADCYDAMTSSRSYRPAMSHDDAIAEITRVSGTQLDPELTRVLLRLCEDDVRWLNEITFRSDAGDG